MAACLAEIPHAEFPGEGSFVQRRTPDQPAACCPAKVVVVEGHGGGSLAKGGPGTAVLGILEHRIVTERSEVPQGGGAMQALSTRKQENGISLVTTTTLYQVQSRFSGCA